MTFASDEIWVRFHSDLSTDDQLAWKVTEEAMNKQGFQIEITDIIIDLYHGTSQVFARIHK